MDRINQKQSRKPHMNLSDLFVVVFVLSISLPLLLVNIADFHHGLNPIAFLVAGVSAVWLIVLLAAFFVFRPIKTKVAIEILPKKEKQEVRFFFCFLDSAVLAFSFAKIKKNEERYANLAESQLPPAPPTRHKIVTTLTPRLVQSPAVSA
jgi:hypothetical protein